MSQTDNSLIQTPSINYNLDSQREPVFHAVYIPRDEENKSVEGSLHVYVDKVAALKIINEHKKGRLKTFKTRAEAESFARNGNQQILSRSQTVPLLPLPEEKTNTFKGPKPQDLVVFRKLIESGDIEAVRKIAWENPRYLVSSADTPAILQEGCRYNALHVAAKVSKTPQMCELILNIVGDPKFVKLFYGEDESKNYLNRAQILLDLYLNTPDKFLNETPLHFAAKFGLKEVVRVLVSYPQCVKTLRNKYQQTPAEITCSRRFSEDETLKREIRNLLEDQYYVPVLRSEDNTLQPSIGEPFSPTSPPQFKLDPISPILEVKAFAGPMTKSQAMEFRRKWKTPPRIICNGPNRRENCSGEPFMHSPVAALRLQDTEKGLERVGRDLASEYKVPWKEYWPFINDFADMRCNEGLKMLEKYLENRFKESIMIAEELKRDQELLKYDKNFQGQLEDHMADPFNETDLCKQLESLNVDDDSEEFFTPPSSPILDPFSDTEDSEDEDMYLAEEGLATYIDGNEPTKLDYAVYNAISTDINQKIYPNIYRWLHEMKVIMDHDERRFNKGTLVRRRLLLTPDKPRFQHFEKS
ncbi:ankyrin repeat and LEM domain-containing protein 2 isoform X2 [Cephus cinctus]|uniref:Ankyrin repeat and LEM domain-containing protein 2 isoform X2 n=1 Tax=Cephus cinctus TaxID=211228 RepID=A0AAJ7BXR1_CEPCN|nr:ankyrin repeat and LEM domain-containing protein 2 isoform X2 [Cephus cinctus]